MTALSQSILWKQMHNYYDEKGFEIWEDEVVPSQITSNTYLANIYAHLIVAQMNDYRASAPKKNDEPFYILELGAGHGKFSFYMLKALEDILAIYDLDLSSICYVMTDISEKNIEYWRKHPAFEKFMAKGILDFALYNAVEDKSFSLTLSKRTIKKSSLSKPLFVLSNYIFDTLPHDAFQIVKGKLYETELVLQAKDKENFEIIFSNNQYVFKQNSVSQNYYKKAKHLNAVLKEYLAHFDEASVLMPVGAVEAIEQFTQFSTNSTMVLVADKGASALSLFEGLDFPDISYHGSISMMVNFDALARYTKLSEGTSLLMADKSADFQVASFIYNASYPVLHTTQAFNMSLSTFSPQDLFNLFYKNDEPNPAFNNLDEVLAILNIANWDPTLFYHYYPALVDCLEDPKQALTVPDLLLIKQGLEKVWSRFFKLEKDQDIPYAIASVLYSIEEIEKSLEFYEASVAFYGAREETYYNMAIGYQALEDNTQALHYTKRALECNAKYKEAKNLMKELA